MRRSPPRRPRMQRRPRSLPTEPPTRAGRSQGSPSASARVGDGRHVATRVPCGTKEAVAGQFLGAARRDWLRPPHSLRSLPTEPPTRAGRSQGSQSASARVGDGRHVATRVPCGTKEAVAGQFLGRPGGTGTTPTLAALAAHRAAHARGAKPRLAERVRARGRRPTRCDLRVVRDQGGRRRSVPWGGPAGLVTTPTLAALAAPEGAGQFLGAAQRD